MQVNVDAAPKLCARFLADLRDDHILQMTPGQLCRYDFLQQHAGKYYQSLDWKPVSGDPVALSMKIYDANLLSSEFTKGTARSRAIFLAYAQDQNRHHALTVDVAPFRLPPLIHSTLIQGYVLRSRGSYCGQAVSDEGTTVSYAAGKVLVAFFADKALQKSIPNLGRNGFTKSFPVKIKDRAVVIGLDTGTLNPHVFGPAGPNFGADIEAIRTFRGLPSQPHRLLVNPDSICDYTVFVKNGLENGVK